MSDKPAIIKKHSSKLSVSNIESKRSNDKKGTLSVDKHKDSCSISLRKKRSKSAIDIFSSNLNSGYLDMEYRTLGPEQIRFLWEENEYWRKEAQSYRKLAQNLFTHFQKISQLSNLPLDIEALVSSADFKKELKSNHLNLGLHMKKWKFKPKSKRKDPLEFVLLENSLKDKKTKAKKALAAELLAELNQFYGDGQAVETLIENLPHLEITTGIAGSAYADVSGPKDEDFKVVQMYKSTIAGVCLSTYPVIEIPNSNGHKERLGIPNCDMFQCKAYKNRLIACVTDGCGWGNRSKKASTTANTEFVNYIEKQIHNATDVQSAALIILKAIHVAHKAVVQDATKIWDVGTTTIVGGVLLQVPPQEAFDAPYVFLCVNIGDCKAYHCSTEQKENEEIDLLNSSLNENSSSDEEKRTPKWSIVDITSGNRASDVKVAGGHLGPKDDGTSEFLPDLTNFSFHLTPCRRGDIIIMMSDGIHDNFDPESLGVEPTGMGLNYDKWSDIDLNDRIILKDSYRTQLLHRQFLSAKDLGPKEIAEWAVRWVSSVTDKKRSFMEQNVGVEEPSDCKLYPGKMDHSTLLSFLVQ